MPNHHPNRLQIPKGPKIPLTKRIWHYWPLAVWLCVIAVTYVAHREGVVFRRMNAALDVDPEAVSPVDNGNFEGYAIDPTTNMPIARGSKVEAGQVVALMKDDQLEEKWALLVSEIGLEREDKLRDLTLSIEKRREEISTLEAKRDGAKQGSFGYRDLAKKIEEGIAAQNAKNLMGLTPEQRAAVEKRLNTQRRDPEVIKLEAKAAEYDIEAQIADLSLKRQNERLEQQNKEMQVMQKDVLAELVGADRKKRDQILAQIDPELRIIATAGQRQQIDILRQREKRLELRATKAGIVDRLYKEAGEYVKAGEDILKIVGVAEQIVGFLPEDQMDAVREGQPVWITPSNDPAMILDSKILYLAPRINSMAEASSPIPNKRVFGRDVVCQLPQGNTLLPGQRLVIHLTNPKDVPLLTGLLRRAFPNRE